MGMVLGDTAKPTRCAEKKAGASAGHAPAKRDRAALRMTRQEYVRGSPGAVRCARDDGLGESSEGGDGGLGDEGVNGDVKGFAEGFEIGAPVFGPGGEVVASEQIVPDVLGLPQIDWEGEGAQEGRDAERDAKRAGDIARGGGEDG